MFQICEYCKKYFRIFSLYEKHIWNFHSRSPQQEALMKSTSTKKKKKVKVKVIKPKIVIEKPKQKVGCDECGKVFMSSSYIELHKKQVHSKTNWNLVYTFKSIFFVNIAHTVYYQVSF